MKNRLLRTLTGALIVLAVLVALMLPMLALPAAVQAADRVMQHQAYHTEIYAVQVAAATATQKTSLFVAPRRCRVLEVSFVPDVATTGDNTNTRNIVVLNASSDGSGVTEVARQNLPTGTNLVAFDEKVIPLIAAFSGGVVLNAGDVIVHSSEKVGTGVNVGPGFFKILWEPN